MDLSKHLDILDPINDITKPISIIGCGAIGSTLAVQLARLGVPKLYLYDFDEVELHNITNQMYRQCDVGRSKMEALTEILHEINPELEVHQVGAYKDQALNGYVFMAVDNIEIRKEIVTNNKCNPNTVAMFDFRMGLYNAQHYAYKWDAFGIQSMYQSMNFSHEEAKANVPMSPCGTTLSVAPTVWTIVSLGVANFIKLIRGKDINNLIIVDVNTCEIVAL